MKLVLMALLIAVSLTGCDSLRMNEETVIGIPVALRVLLMFVEILLIWGGFKLIRYASDHKEEKVSLYLGMASWLVAFLIGVMFGFWGN